MKTEILKLNGIFNMSFGKTFFTGETQNINTFINGKSKWDIFIDDIYLINEELNNFFWIRGDKTDTNIIQTKAPIKYLGYDKQEIKNWKADYSRA